MATRGRSAISLIVACTRHQQGLGAAWQCSASCTCPVALKPCHSTEQQPSEQAKQAGTCPGVSSWGNLQLPPASSLGLGAFGHTTFLGSGWVRHSSTAARRSRGVKLPVGLQGRRHQAATDISQGSTEEVVELAALLAANARSNRGDSSGEPLLGGSAQLPGVQRTRRTQRLRRGSDSDSISDQRPAQMAGTDSASELRVGQAAYSEAGEGLAGPPGLPLVSAEVAAEVAARRRHSSMARLPEGLRDVLTQYAEGSGVKPAQLRSLSHKLLVQLQEADAAAKPSRSKDAAGGGGPRYGKERGAAAVDRVAIAFEVDGINTLDTATLHKALNLPPPERENTSRRGAEVASSYKSPSQVLAYAAARAAPVHAALTRVLRELAALSPIQPGPEPRPAFSPRAVLDYGAKAGLSLWAINEVWPAETRSLLAVEPSLPMSDLGMKVEMALKQHLVEAQEETPWGMQGDGRGEARQRPPGPMVNWVRALPPLRTAPQMREKYDLVLCSYALSEAADGDRGREQLVRSLWEMTSDVLVIIEPGTPTGFSNVRAARAQILAREERRRAKALDAVADTSSSAAQAPKLNVHSAAKLRSTGAHVVAPCPHDKPCPMEGERMWCHFGQRLERPGFVQRLLPGARSHQDELFSYVILRRGPRPTQIPEVAIARAMVPTPASASWALPEGVVKKQMMLNRLAAQTQAGAGEAFAAGMLHSQQANGQPAAQELLHQEMEMHLQWLEQGLPLPGEEEEEDSSDVEGADELGEADGPTYQMGHGMDDLQDPLLDLDVGGAHSLAQHQTAHVPDSTGLKGRQGRMTEPAHAMDETATMRLLRSLAAESQQAATAADAGVEPDLAKRIGSRQPLFAASNVSDTSRGAREGANGSSDADARAGQPSSMAADTAPQIAGPLSTAFTARFPQYGFGLIDRLILMEETGMKWAKTDTNQTGLTMDMAQLASSVATAVSPATTSDMQLRQQPASGPVGAEPVSVSGVAMAVKALSEHQLTQEEEREAAVQQLKHEVFGLGADGEDRDKAEGADAELSTSHAAHEEHVRLALQSSMTWPRIYRPPRVRGGHVILDLCMPKATTVEASESPAGTSQLERHVVTRSDAKGWMGRAAWELARQVRWGDLWPAWYSNNRRKQAVLDPDSPEARHVNKERKQARHKQEQSEIEAALRHFGFDAPSDRKHGL